MTSTVRRGLALLLVGAASVFFVSSAQGADKPKPPHGPSHVPEGRERDITRPGEKRKMIIWRNGKYEVVEVSVERKVVTATVTGPDGKPQETNTEVMTMDGGSVEQQLPPPDPNARPVTEATHEEYEAAKRAAGFGDEPGPPPNAAQQAQVPEPQGNAKP